MAGLLDDWLNPQPAYGGLLGAEDMRRAQQMGLFGGLGNVASALIQAGQPSRFPGGGIGGALGAFVPGYLGGQQGAMDSAIKAKLVGQQFERGNMELQRARDQQAAMQRIAGRFGPQSYQVADASGNTPAPSFDMASIVRDPSMFGDFVTAYGLPAAVDMSRKQDDTAILPEGGSLVRKGTGQVIASGSPKQTEIEKELLAAGYTQGTPEYQNALRAIIARKGQSPQVNVNVPVNTEKTLYGNLAEGYAKQINDQREVAQRAASQVGSIGIARDILNQGIISGAGADVRLQIARALNTAGITDNPDVATTEAFMATVGRQTLDLVKQLGSGVSISNADRDYADKVAGAKIAFSKEGLQRILDINEKVARQAVQRYNKMAQPLTQDPNVPAFMRGSILIEEPPPRQSAQTGKGRGGFTYLGKE